MASGANNAVARVAELVAIAAIGLVVTARFDAGIHDRLEGSVSPAAARSIAQAKERSLVRPSSRGCRPTSDPRSTRRSRHRRWPRFTRESG